MAKRLILCATLSILWFQSFLGLASTHTIANCHSLMALSFHSFQTDFLNNKKLLLLVFDFEDFMCISCLESFLAFCQSLPSHVLEENTWGILTIGNLPMTSGSKDSVRIAKAKLRGFVATNRIKFPIIIDEFQIFQHFAKRGTTVLLFDGTNDSLNAYDVPLRKDQIREIQKTVTGF